MVVIIYVIYVQNFIQVVVSSFISSKTGDEADSLFVSSAGLDIASPGSISFSR